MAKSRRKGRQLRPAIPRPNMARVIVDQNDSTRDRFISNEDANALYLHDKLKPVDVGDAYPNSYVRC